MIIMPDTKKEIIVVQTDCSADQEYATTIYTVPRDKYKEEILNKWGTDNVKVLSEFHGGDPIIVEIDYCSG